MTANERGRPLGKPGVDDEADTFNATVDEYTIEESAKPRVSRAPKVGDAKGTLNIVAGNDKGRTFQLTGRRLSIGRGIDNDIVLTDLAVSRQHLAIDFAEGRYYIRDLGSGNGTLVNDVEERGRLPVWDGDRIEVGNTIIHCELPNQKRAPSETMSLEENDSSLIPLANAADAVDEISTFAGKKDKDVRRLVGAGVAKALAQRRNSQLQQPSPGSRSGLPEPPSGLPSLANRVTQPRSSAKPSGPPESAPGLPGLRTQAPSPGHREVGRPPVPAPKPPAKPSAEPQALSGPAPSADPLDRALDGLSSLPSSLQPGFGPTRPGPRPEPFAPKGFESPGPSIPPPGAQPLPNSAPWGPSSDSLPVSPPATISQAGRLRPARPPTAPVVYGDDRLPMAGANITGPEGVPKLAHLQGGPRTNNRRKLMMAGIGAALALVIIGGVALAALGGDGETTSGDEVVDSAGDTADNPKKLAASDKPDKLEAKDSDAKDTPEKKADEPTLVASLPAATWGTEETKLRAEYKFTEASPTPGAEGDKPDEGQETENAPAPGEQKEDEQKEDEQKEVKKDPPRVAPPRERRESRSARRRRLKAERAARLRAERARRAARAARLRKERERRAAIRRSRPTRSETPTRSSGSSSRDKSRAAALYKQKKFTEAASLLESASKKAGGSEGKKLAALARSYAQVGTQLRKGDGAGSDATQAANAYGAALRADRRAGGAHQGLLRLKLKLKAPKAAKTYMARRDYKGARRMAELATSVGAKSQVSSVFSSLERKATQIVKAGNKAAKRGDKSGARKKYKQAQSIAPRNSSAYKAARAGLRKL